MKKSACSNTMPALPAANCGKPVEVSSSAAMPVGPFIIGKPWHRPNGPMSPQEAAHTLLLTQTVQTINKTNKG